MNLTKFSILVLFILVIISCNAVSASNLSFDGNYSQIEGDVAEIDSDNMPIKQIDETVLEDSPNTQSSSTEDYTIYVGTNSTHDGKGTEEDPYATLELACNNYNSAGQQKDTVNVVINDGTYYMGSYLKFNTNNLNIIGNGSVIIKNLYNDKEQSFGSNCNFSMSNIIFNASNFNYVADFSKNAWFVPFIGSNGNIIFDNCTFADYNDFDTNNRFYNCILPQGINFNTWAMLNSFINDNIEFNYCQFISSHKMAIGYIDYPCNVRFNYCNLGGNFFEGLGLFDGTTFVFDSCWLGHNNGYTDTFFAMKTYNPQGQNVYNGFMYRNTPIKNSLFANRHAVLEVSENYLGNNTYEIIGKLLWNDGTDDNINKLGSMTVYLSADNGIIPNTATLENGAFNVTYSSDSDYHEITVEWDSQKIKLNNKLNFTLNAPTINYGDNQNITVTFPTNVNGTVYVTVNNKTYRKYCDNQNNVTVTIDDILTKGNYSVDVSFAHDKNEFDVVLHDLPSKSYYTVDEFDSFGFNTTTITVLGIASSLNTSSVTTNYNVTKDLVATLTDINGEVLANKTVNIVVGNIDKNLTTDDNGQVSVDVSSLVPGSYVASISFAGDNIYGESDSTADVIINKVIPNVNISYGDLIPGEKLIINVEIPYATENVTIIVNGDKNTTKLVDNAATYTIDELTEGTYYVTVLYAGDELCDFAYKTDSFDVVKSTADLIKELNENITAKDAVIDELNANVTAKDAVIDELNANVTAKDAVIDELN
ncbi:MAG: Ig-like domain repeat protein, partial [Methanobrevibacter thaueri]|nr:Ig-like domain repeat protein [Methanobrevibacter thaueri]